jgi:L-iditol 2-dehydrogenase
MRAAFLVAPGTIELRDVPIPVPEPGGLVVRVRAALTDGTDVKAYRRGHPQMPFPTPFGHEFSGDVAAVGDGVRDFAPGDAVMCVHSSPCGDCRWCLGGQEELCSSVMNTKILGAYADYIAVPARIVAVNCFRKPAHLTYEQAAFLEPLACVVHSIETLRLAPGSHVAILGDGGFGLLHALVARAYGWEPILVGRRDERLALARDLGLAHVVDARSGDPSAYLAALTNGDGADAAVECTGTVAAWEYAPSLVRRGGTVSFFGGLPADTTVSFSAARLHYDELRLISPFHFGRAAVRRAYELLCAGALPVTRLISGRMPLPEIARAFELLDRGFGVKIAIEP